MVCEKCGKNIENGVKVCPNCNNSINSANNRIADEVTPMNYMEFKEKKDMVKPKRSHKTGVIIVGVFALIVFGGILGSNGNGETKVNTTSSIENGSTESMEVVETEPIELSLYIGKKEEDVCAEFGYPINEMGCYPSDENPMFSVGDGTVAMVKLQSFIDPILDYKIWGIRVGDKWEDVKKDIDSNLIYNYEQKRIVGTSEEGMIYVYTSSDNKRLFEVDVNKEGVIVTLTGMNMEGFDEGLYEDNSEEILQDSEPIIENVAENDYITTEVQNDDSWINTHYIYGKYYYINGEWDDEYGKMITYNYSIASVEYWSGDDLDAIYIEARSPGDDSLYAVFEGVLIPSEIGNYYTAEDDLGSDMSIGITFLEDGMIIDAWGAGAEYIQGEYILDETYELP